MSSMVNKIMLAVIVILVGAVVYLGVNNFTLNSELNNLNKTVMQRSGNQKTVVFLQLFIKDVLKSNKEVDFETRLKLENAVRATDDGAILAQWQKFINSKDEMEAQANTKDLLDILAKKIGSN